MIVCGFCGHGTEPGLCSYCGRDPELPYAQRGDKAPTASQSNAGGRPRLDAGQIRQVVRIAQKELGQDVTQAALAEHLNIDVRTLGRWRKLTGL